MMAKSASNQSLMSMTGFASTTGAFENYTWVTEIRAVNGRGLDLRLRLPDWVDGLEPAVRGLIQSRLGRGNVTASIKLQRSNDVANLVLNQDALAATLETLGRIESAASEAGVSLAATTAVDIASMRGVLDLNDTDTPDDTAPLRTALVASMTDALAAFEADRAREGSELARVLGDQIERVATLSMDAAAALGDREAATKAAMRRGLERLLDTTDVPDEARLTQELALIAVKNDVTEELDRLSAHVAAAKDLMQTKGPVGRKFDFLMQEFNREANTLCSKSQSNGLTAIGLDLKAVIDQMREQVQNIE